MTLSAQNSTGSIPTNSVVILNGQKYVLVPEKTFGKIEKLTAELPALRDENTALKAEKANADQVIAKQTELHTLDQQIIESQTKALAATEKQAASEKAAADSYKKALDVSQTENARLKKQVSKWKKIAVIGWAVAAVKFLLP